MCWKFVRLMNGDVYYVWEVMQCYFVVNVEFLMVQWDDVLS